MSYNTYENPDGEYINITQMNDPKSVLQANMQKCQLAIVTDGNPPYIAFTDHNKVYRELTIQDNLKHLLSQHSDVPQYTNGFLQYNNNALRWYTPKLEDLSNVSNMCGIPGSWLRFNGTYWYDYYVSDAAGFWKNDGNGYMSWYVPRLDDLYDVVIDCESYNQTFIVGDPINHTWVNWRPYNLFPGSNSTMVPDFNSNYLQGHPASDFMLYSLHQCGNSNNEISRWVKICDIYMFGFNSGYWARLQLINRYFECELLINLITDSLNVSSGSFQLVSGNVDSNNIKLIKASSSSNTYSLWVNSGIWADVFCKVIGETDAAINGYSCLLALSTNVFSSDPTASAYQVINLSYPTGYFSSLVTNSNEIYHYSDILSYKIDATSQVGTIKITYPSTWDSNMFQLTIRGYHYNSGTPSTAGNWEIKLSGYPYVTGSQWYATSYTIIGNAPFTNVRFGYDTINSKCCILLGTTSSNWSYPRIELTDFYTKRTDRNTGWAINLISDEIGITFPGNDKTSLGDAILGDITSNGNAVYHTGNLTPDNFVQGDNSRRSKDFGSSDLHTLSQSGFYRSASDAINNPWASTVLGYWCQHPTSSTYGSGIFSNTTGTANHVYYLRNANGTWYNNELWHNGNFDPSLKVTDKSNADWNTLTSSCVNMNVTNGVNGTSAYMGLHVQHSTSSNYSFDILGRNQHCYYRAMENGVYTPYYELWSTYNFDPASKANISHASTHAAGGSDALAYYSINAMPHIQNNITVAAAGWYRIAVFPATLHRGWIDIDLFVTGGSYSPKRCKICIHTTNSVSDTNYYYSESESLTYWDQFRVTYNATTGDKFVEVHFKQALTASLYSILNNCWAGYSISSYSGALPADDGTTTVIGGAWNFSSSGFTSAYSNFLLAGSPVHTGSGTTNKLARYTNGSSAVLGDSLISDDGSKISISGSVGIGTAPSTGYPLDIIQTVSSNLRLKVNSDSSLYAQIYTQACNAAGTNQASSYLISYNNAITGTELGINKAGSAMLELQSVANNACAIGTYSNSDLVFSTNNAEKMRITKTGRVGIGTNSPSDRVHIYSAQVHIEAQGTGSSTIDSNTWALQIAPLHNRASTANSYFGGIAFNHLLNYNGSTGYNSSPQAWIGLRLYDTPGSERSYLVFATKEGTTNTDLPIERMVIDPFGKVGIGKTPSYPLDINTVNGGSVYFRGDNGFCNYLECAANNTLQVGDGGSNYIRFGQGNTAISSAEETYIDAGNGSVWLRANTTKVTGNIELSGMTIVNGETTLDISGYSADTWLDPAYAVYKISHGNDTYAIKLGVTGAVNGQKVIIMKCLPGAIGTGVIVKYGLNNSCTCYVPAYGYVEFMYNSSGYWTIGGFRGTLS